MLTLFNLGTVVALTCYRPRKTITNINHNTRFLNLFHETSEFSKGRIHVFFSHNTNIMPLSCLLEGTIQ
jgi:hypothetical protein